MNTGRLEHPTLTNRQITQIKIKQGNAIANRLINQMYLEIITRNFTQTQSNIPAQHLMEPSAKLTTYLDTKQFKQTEKNLNNTLYSTRPLQVKAGGKKSKT